MVQLSYIEILSKKLADRQEKNPKYSLRSFSMHLGLDPGSLSSILRGRRPLSPINAEQVINRLELSDFERKQFYLSLLFRQKIPQEILEDQIRFQVDEVKHFCILSEWEYSAVLCLANINKFQLTASNLTSVLKISLKRSQIVLSTLESSGFLKKQGKLLQPVQQKFSTSEDTFSAALQLSHLRSLKMAKQKLQRLNIHERDFSSLTLAVNSKKLKQMKSFIRNFRRQFETQFESDCGDVIVQLNLQLFPISEKICNKGSSASKKIVKRNKIKR